jgi:hypothetical protein
MDNPQKIKRCPKCQEDKTLEDYHKNSAAYNGKQTYCKVCTLLADKIKRDNLTKNGPTIIRTEKMCLDCKIIKKIDDFGMRKNAPDWHLTYCKPCWVIRITKYQRKGL